jgi:predicted DNA-binding transcriptional regulator AlpA
METSNKDFVRTRKETADILRVSVNTLRRMELRGKAPARTMITDRIVGYRQSAIDHFLSQRTTSAA